MSGQEPPEEILEEKTESETCSIKEKGAADLPSAEPASQVESEPKQEKKSPREAIGRTFGLVALVTFLSKFIGLARDIAILTVFGTSNLTDAYYFAYLVTGNILVLFGGLGGPFSSGAVSIITPGKEKETPGVFIS